VGHWVCQCLEGRAAPVYCRAEDVSAADESARALEREANVFAAELLMPEPAVRAAFASDAAGVAASFGVSEEAMAWRLYNFALVQTRPVR
jgi:Zn-dependent peptidase ImmA (M78 family)